MGKSKIDLMNPKVDFVFKCIFCFLQEKNAQSCKEKYTILQEKVHKNVYFFIDSLLSVLLCNFDRQISINGCGVSICQSWLRSSAHHKIYLSIY